MFVRTARSFLQSKKTNASEFFFNQIRTATRVSGTNLAQGTKPPHGRKKNPPEGGKEHRPLSAETEGTRFAASPKRRQFRQPTRSEEETTAGTRHIDANETRTGGEPTQPEPRETQSADMRTRRNAGTATATPPTTGGAKTPQQTGGGGTRRNAAFDGTDGRTPTENKADGELAAPKRTKQHRKHPQTEKRKHNSRHAARP